MKINHWNKTSVSKSEMMDYMKSVQNLKHGHVFKAEILDIKQNELLLQLLSDGSKINAQMSSQSQYTIGQSMYFKVLSSSDQQVVIESITAQTESPKTELIINALNAAQVSTTKKNIAIVEALLQNNLPIDKNHIQQLIGEIDVHGADSLEKLMFLIKNQIGISKNNLEQLEGYINHSIGLKSQIEEIISYVTEIEDPALKQEILQSILNKPIENTSIHSITHINDFITENQVALNEMKESIVSTSYSDEEIKGFVREAISKMPQGAQLTQLFQQDEDLFDFFLKSIITFDDLPLQDPVSHKNAVESKIIRQVLIDRLLIDSKELKNPRILNEYYNDLSLKIDKLKQILNYSPESEVESLSRSLDGIKQNIDFLNQLSSFNSYIQIPLKGNEFIKQGDLYILKNQKKNKKNQGNSITALVALDLRNLGHLEALISKTNNLINCQFRVEDEATQDLLKSKINVFQKKLYTQGFILQNTSYILSDKKFDILQIDDTQDDIQQDIRRYSFDMRV